MLAAGTTAASAAAAPVLTATEIPIDGGAVTITGTGFAGVSPGVYLGLAKQGLAGFYAASTDTSFVDSETVWISAGQVSGGTSGARTEPMTAEGTFEVTINVPAGTDTSYSIYTSKAHGQGNSDRSQNASLNLTYVAPVVVVPPVVVPSITATEIPAAGGTVTVTGSGFAANTTGIYLGVAAQGFSDFYAAGVTRGNTIAVNTGYTSVGANSAPMNSDGTFTVTVTVPANDGTTTYAVYASKGRQTSSADSSQNAITNLVYAAPVVVVPPVVVPSITATEIPAAGGTVTVTGSGFAANTTGIYLGVAAQGFSDFYAAGVTRGNTIAVNTGYTSVGANSAPMNSDGTFTVTVTVPANDGTTTYAVYASKGRQTSSADSSQNAITNLVYAAPVVVTPPPAATPAITVTEIPAGGGAVTVTGTGFSTTAPGIYVAAGHQGTGNLYNTPGVDTAAAVAVQTTYTEPTASRAVMNADGSFTTTVNVPANDGTTKWAIYTSKAQGVGAGRDTTQNTTTNLVYAVSTEVPPVVTPPVTTPPVTETPITTPPVTGADGITVVQAEANSNGLSIGYSAVSVSGGTITISGSGYDPTSPGIYVGLAPRGFAGFYAASGALLPGTVHVKVGNVEGETAAGRTAPMNADGSFSISFALPAADGTEYAIYTSKAHGQGVSNTSQDAVVDFAFNTRRVLGTVDEAPVEIPIAPVVTAPVVSPVSETPAAVAAAAAAAAPEEVCVARSVSGATLNWAIKDSFRTYIRGGIANGSWDLSSVGDADGKFVWSGGTGAYNTDASRGTISFPGTVHFTGHDGQLDITITDVKLRLSSASSATLTASFNSTALDGTVTNEKNVAFANVAINSASTTGAKLTISNATTTLTTAGAVAFGGFYDAGSALAPLSLTAPLGASVECTDATYSSLATTGTNDITGGLLLAALLALVGFGALSQSRRRSIRTAEVTSI